MELLAIYVASAHTKQWRIEPIGGRLMSRGSNDRVDMIRHNKVQVHELIGMLQRHSYGLVIVKVDIHKLIKMWDN